MCLEQKQQRNPAWIASGFVKTNLLLFDMKPAIQASNHKNGSQLGERKIRDKLMQLNYILWQSSAYLGSKFCDMQ